MRNFYRLPAESKAAVVVTVRAASSKAIGTIWANLGVPSDGPDGDTVPRKSYDTDMAIAVWVIGRLLDQKASAQDRLQRNAQVIRYLRGRTKILDRAWQTERAAAISNIDTILGVSREIDRLNDSDPRPLIERVTSFVDCELLRRANNG